MSLHELNTSQTRPFDSPLPAALLNIDDRRRTNFFPWRGQFSPELIEALLRSYSAHRDVVLDPFAGSGTVLLEAGRLGHIAYGTEINPAAAIIARLYEFINLQLEERKEVSTRVAALLRGALGKSFPASPNDDDLSVPVEALLQLSEEAGADRTGTSATSPDNPA